MIFRAITALVALAAASPCRADILPLVANASSRICRPAIGAAERAYNIPQHLLAAIGRVESGRKDSASDTFNPWPWTVNAEGQSFFYDSKAQAVAAVRDMQQHGMRSIDVGCMQISLLHHPGAFSSLEQAFEPADNADYGARFLTQLHEQTSSWPRAVEMYHSATPGIGEEYGRRVYAALPDEQRLPGTTLIGLGTGLAPTMSPFSPVFRPSPARVIAIPSTASTGTSPGRGLDAYRAAPIRLAARIS